MPLAVKGILSFVKNVKLPESTLLPGPVTRHGKGVRSDGKVSPSWDEVKEFKSDKSVRLGYFDSLRIRAERFIRTEAFYANEQIPVGELQIAVDNGIILA